MINHTKLLTSLGLATGLVLLLGPAALAAGDSNQGDIWVDTATAQTTGVSAAGPGHENDPHLACTDVGVFAAKMADPTKGEANTFTIYAWPPTGSQNRIYTGSWTYTSGAPDAQEIAIIPVSVFRSGGHFKIQVTQDPLKQKVFWVDCSAAVSSPIPHVSTSPTPPSATPTPSPTSSSTPATSSSPGSGGGTGGVGGGSAFGDVLAATATALAVTGTPLYYLALGILLVVLGAGFYLARHRLRIV